MIRNYFKIAWRNLLRNKGFSIINISGLAIGMASAILILLWVQNEMSHDRFYAKQDRLYEVWSNDKVNGSIRSLNNTPEIMAPGLKKDYPEIEDATRLQWTRNLFSASRENKLMSTGAVVDSGFLDMFSFRLLNGNPSKVLADPHSIVVTQKLALRLFNGTDVVGKTLVMGDSDNYTVTGVLQDMPDNTVFNFIEYLCSYEGNTNVDRDWTDISVPTYVLLRPHVSAGMVSEKIKNIIPKHTNGAQKTQEFLYPVSRLWLYSQFENGKAVGGRIVMVKIFILIAAFILLIACINFMNLSTARSEKRAREVGIRKVSGALKTALVGQFIAESIFISFISALIAMILVVLFLPAFNELVQKQLFLPYNQPGFWIAGIGFVLLTGVLAGSYPAFFLSSLKPVVVLKGGFKKVSALITPRKILVVVQFTCAVALIIATIVAMQQIKYAQERDIGYKKDQLVHIYLDDEMRKDFSLIKQDLLTANVASSVAEISAPLTQNWSSAIGLEWQGKDPNLKVQVNRSAEEGDLVKTAGFRLLQGRDIDVKNYPSDSTACLINESALKLMSFKDPIGQIIKDYPVAWHVVGVIADYIQDSPYQPVKPMIIKGPRDWMGVILVRLNGNIGTAKNLANMEKIFKRYNPSYPFEYTFTSEEYAQKFSNEQLIKELAGLFAALTIFISCLGLFGLATYMAANRIKEIGIRKVLGASATGIAALLSKDFIKLVVVSIVIASAVAWWAMNKWLLGFDYRIRISPWIFLVAGSLAILIALVTVSFQSIKAAMANPVKSLRSE